ncbi:ATP-binding cassette domain-containing protein [Rhodopila sp.]|uniref:ABC transporter ATP-binding protein/permease n=1 Tax=Rhodopila sp. TaxID=2480087 RepID=UPI003D1490F8
MRRPVPALLPWLAGLLALYLIAPFIVGLAQFGLADWRSIDWGSIGGACAVSLVTASLATLVVTLGGVPLGYLLARVSGRAMALLGFIVQLPLALPPLASGILLLFLLGYASPIGRLTGGTLTDSITGIILAEAFVSAPFLIIAARSAFAAMDPVLEDVAATLGHRPWAVFVRVSLPLVWRQILAGMLLAWLRAFGEFGATVMVAYHPYSLPVYTYVAFGSQGLPAMLPVLLPTLLAAVAVMALAALFGNRRKRRRSPPTVDILQSAARPDAAKTAPRRAGSPDRLLGFTFGRHLDGFDLNITWHTKARRLAILGASGSGKSLTLRLIAGLDRVQDGCLELAGRDLFACPPDQRGIAYVPQAYGLFPHLTVIGQLLFAKGSDPAIAAQWIDRLGLRGLKHRLPDALSLGQQQRVALARAFSRPAGLLLLDEPFSALDAPLRIQLRRELRALQGDIDATTILVTHDPEEAFLLADELLILDAGQVLQAGSVDSVYARPASETVARLLGADNIAYGCVAAADCIDIGNRVRLDVAGPALQAGARVGWSARPESIRIVSNGLHPARIIDVSRSIAGRREVWLELGDCLLRASHDAGKIVPGPCRVTVDPAAVQAWTSSAAMQSVDQQPYGVCAEHDRT